jgi:phage minor structural protein
MDVMGPIWHVLDKNYNVVGNINSGTPKGCPLLRDNWSGQLTDGYVTLDFDVPSDHPTAKALEEGAFIVYTDKIEGYDYELFRVVKPTIATGLENTLTCVCETAATEDLLGTLVDPWSATGRNFSVVLQYLLQNTGWELGECYYDIVIDYSTSDYPTSLQAIRDLVTAQGGEIEFKIEWDGLNIIRKVVNVYEKRGNQNTGITFEYEKNLRGLRKIVDRNKIVTAMVAVASKQNSDGTPILIKDAQKALPEGFIKENNRIIDLNALQLYSNNGKNVEDKFIDQNAANAVTLQDNTLAALQKVNKPIESWEADVEYMEGIEGYNHDEAKIGDGILIQDFSRKEPQVVRARILTKNKSIKNQTQGSVSLGEYQYVKLLDREIVEQMKDTLALKEEGWNQAIEDAKNAQEAAEEAKNSVSYKVELSSSKGNVFRNGVIDTVIRAVIFKGNTDITSSIPSNQIVWKKYNEDGTQDTSWSKSGSSFTFTREDMNKKARITCELIIEESLKARAEQTFIDVSDGVVSGIEPANPTEGLLWIDTNRTPNMLKKYINGQWVDLGELDTEISEKIQAIDNQLTDMASDSTVSIIERQMVKDRLTEILGKVMGDNEATLPTATALDTSLKGAFFAIRKSATYAGIATDDTKYTAIATKYSDLKAYLDAMTPIKPWDTSEPRSELSISVNPTVWRDKWLQYYLAYTDLETAIQQKQKENVDNLQIGARNYIRNSRFQLRDIDGRLTSWDANADWTVLEPEEDKPNSGIITIKQEGNTSNVYHAFISNKTGAKKGDIFTLSYDFKVADVSKLDTRTLGVLEFYDATGDRILYHNIYIEDTGETLESGKWVRLAFTMTATLDAITSVAVRFDLFKNGEIFIREPQLEKGQKATDPKDAPEDAQGQVAILQERVTNVEQNTSSDAIVSAVTQSTTYLADMSAKADADKLGDYATKDELEGAVGDATSYVDEKIAGIDYTPYVKNSELQQTVDALKADFSAAGGINMLRNSIGFAGTSFWEMIEGNLLNISNSEVEQLGFSRAWYSPASMASRYNQTIYTTVGQTYTISFIMNVRSGSNWAGIDLLNQLGDNVTFLGKGSGELTNGYERFSFTFTAETSVHTVSITVDASNEAVITGLMLNIGERPLQWAMHPEENYNTVFQSDLNGVKVNRIEDGVVRGFTRMSPERFAGYYDVDNNGEIDEGKNSPDEVFRVDGDEFVQKKAVVKEEITMGAIKVVKINSDAVQGWAFVGNEDDEEG